jgi:hypothetical protein
MVQRALTANPSAGSKPAGCERMFDELREQVVAFLAADEASFIAGRIASPNGGYVM